MRGRAWLALIGAITLSCGGGRVSPATAPGQDQEPRLASPITIPGSGVRFAPPRGAELLPLGPGVEIEALAMTIVVALAEGDETTRRTFREGLLEGGDGRRSEVELGDGTRATLGRDTLGGPTGAAGRMWLVAERSTRILALLCTWADGSDPEIERLAIASLTSVEWDETHALSPSEAIGLSLGPAPEMAADARSLGTVALTEGGVGFPPPAGVPMAFLLPLAEEAPDEETLEGCMAVLARAGVLTSPEGQPAPLELDEGWGCAQYGEHHTRDAQLLSAYGAVIFLPVGPVLLTAMVAPERREEWAARFEALPRTVRYLR